MDTLPDTMPEPRAAPPRRRWPRVALGATLALGVGIAAGHQPLARWWIVREARSRGIEIAFEGMSLRLGEVSLGDVRARLHGVAEVEALAKEVKIELSRLSPVRITARGAGVRVEGPLTERVAAVSAWADAHPNARRMKASMQGYIALADRPDQAPWLLLAGRGTGAADGSGHFEGEARLQGTSAGVMGSGAKDAEGNAKPNALNVGLQWAAEGPVVMGLGATAPERAPLRASWDLRARPITADVTLAPVGISAISNASGATLPASAQRAQVEGTGRLVLGGARGKSAITGTASFDVTGWVPPHPEELDGLMFGAKTRLGADFEVAEDRQHLTLSKVTLAAGAFQLAGTGTVDRDGDHTRLRADMRGAIPCSELGASALKAHVGGALGGLLQGMARTTLGGTVKVRIQVDADSRHLASANVDQSATVDCRLR